MRAIIVVLVAAVVACEPSRDTVLEPRLPTDTAAPTLTILSPSRTRVDENGDHLVDLRVVWADSGSGIDVASAAVTHRLDVPRADAAVTALADWIVETIDTVGLRAHENLIHLLSAGSGRLEVAVADRAGNVGRASIEIDLAFGEQLTTIATGIGAGSGMHLVLCPDDRKVYMTGGRNIIVVDADTLALEGIYRDPYAADWLNRPLCLPGDSILLVASRVDHFDRKNRRWLPPIPGSFGAYSMAQSRRQAVAEYGGFVGLYDRDSSRRLATVPLPPPRYTSGYTWDVAVTPDDQTLYVARGGEPLLVVDPQTGTVLAELAESVYALHLSRASDRLWALTELGLWAYRTDLNTPVSFFRAAFAQEFAISPDERRAFITTQDLADTIPGDNLLIDINSNAVLQRFPRPHPPGTFRWDGGAVFHPLGHLVFVGRDRDIDVYLVRP